MRRTAAWEAPAPRPGHSTGSRQEPGTFASWTRPPHAVRDHLPADDLEPAQRPAIVARIAGIDAREAAAAQELDALEVGRVADHHPLGAVSRKHGVELLVHAERLGRRPLPGAR